jgi:hypothetical protein
LYINANDFLKGNINYIIRKLSFSNWFVSFFCCWGNWIYGLLCVHMIVFRWTTVPSSGWWRTWTHSMKMLYPFYKIHQIRLLLLFGRMVMSSFWLPQGEHKLLNGNKMWDILSWVKLNASDALRQGT